MATQWTEDEAMTREVSQNLMYAVMHMNKKLLHADQLSAQFDMPMSSIQLIFALSNGEQTVSQLAEYLAIHKPNVAPIVNQLEDTGFVARRTSTADRRKTYVHLLPKGEKLCQEIQDAICSNLFAGDETVAKSEVKNLNKALAIINKQMKSEKA
ncbi:MAG: MarR family transcriptional regulator [Clostridiales bacterium]|nr:MarR family transcriptional regulator [Clostridia bacterium]MCR4882729.1 MarR family transcriptional regulator [Clostridiales bacterium]